MPRKKSKLKKVPTYGEKGFQIVGGHQGWGPTKSPSGELSPKEPGKKKSKKSREISHANKLSTVDARIQYLMAHGYRPTGKNDELRKVSKRVSGPY